VNPLESIIPLRGSCLRFIIGNGEQLKKKLQDFPTSWVNYFAASKILVIGLVNDNPIAAYGVRSILNVAVLYVKEDYRGQHVGRQMWEKIYDEARKRGIPFFTAEVPFYHLSSKYGLLLFSRYGCKVIKRLEKRKVVLAVFPFTFRGHIAYTLLLVACSMVPAFLLGPISEWMAKRTSTRG